MTNKINNEPAAKYESAKPVKSYSGLSDIDLLAELSSANQAKSAYEEYGSLREIAANTDLMTACLELSKRYLFEQVQRGDALCSPAQTRQYLQLQLGSYPHEVFACLFLDNRNRVIAFEKMFYGTIDGASVYPREVVKEALKHNAAAVIFAHNHPSGAAEPSRADEQITKRLKDALNLVDIRVLDHFIVGDEVVSFAERGLI